MRPALDSYYTGHCQVRKASFGTMLTLAQSMIARTRNIRTWLISSDMTFILYDKVSAAH